MFHCQLETIITTLTDRLRDRNAPITRLPDARFKQTGILFSFDTELCFYPDNAPTRSKRECLWFGLHGNTCVWFARAKHPYLKEGMDWGFACNHDDCWRGDGVGRTLSKVYFEWAKEVNDDVAPAKLVQHVWPHVLGEKAEFTWEKDKECEISYRRKLIEVNGFAVAHAH